jgi:hypothetical protein
MVVNRRLQSVGLIVSGDRLEPARRRRIFARCPNSDPLSWREKGNPGFGWVVDVLWPDGETEVVKGFATEQQAAEWIAKHSEGWQGKT